MISFAETLVKSAENRLALRGIDVAIKLFSRAIDEFILTQNHIRAKEIQTRVFIVNFSTRSDFKNPSGSVCDL
jgi:hypothetical protein